MLELACHIDVPTSDGKLYIGQKHTGFMPGVELSFLGYADDDSNYLEASLTSPLKPFRGITFEATTNDKQHTFGIKCSTLRVVLTPGGKHRIEVVNEIGTTFTLIHDYELAARFAGFVMQNIKI